MMSLTRCCTVSSFSKATSGETRTKPNTSVGSLRGSIALGSTMKLITESASAMNTLASISQRWPRAKSSDRA